MPTAVPEPAKATLDLDRRTAIGIGVALVCLGIIVGFKLAGGEPLVIDRPVYTPVPTAVPCAECAEKKIQTERAEANRPPETVE